ncbi:MAG: ACP phosphodiesterase [Alcanivoracaceae bacterium]|nr:ACP phosphodiesterase [Alcanivoracaceae bacterium]
MNWLAHASLAPADPQLRLGNLIADLVKGSARQELSERVKLGMAHHQLIDAFTDSHELVWQSRRRLPSQYRRYSGILVDVFYDHILAREWDTYHSQSFQEFTGVLYSEVRDQLVLLPADSRVAMTRMIDHDLLGSYQHATGIEFALQRISERFNRRRGLNLTLEDSVEILSAQYGEFSADFAQFFPELRQHLKTHI